MTNNNTSVSSRVALDRPDKKDQRHLSGSDDLSAKTSAFKRFEFAIEHSPFAIIPGCSRVDYSLETGAVEFLEEDKPMGSDEK